MQAAVIVFLGAGLGGVLRHMMNVLGLRLFGLGGFPFTTMIVNVTGCFIMGLATGWFASRYGEGWPQGARLLLTTGMLGGYTTFSTFSLEFAVLVERGENIADQLAWSIRMLYEHPALCAEMGAAGAKRAKDFSVERYYTEFVRIVQDMLQNGGAV